MNRTDPDRLLTTEEAATARVGARARRGTHQGMSTRISSQAAAEREHARHHDGTFGEKKYARAASIDLDTYGLDDDWAVVLDVDQNRLDDAEQRRQDALAQDTVSEQAETAAESARRREAERAHLEQQRLAEQQRRARQARDAAERERAAAKARRLAAVDAARDTVPLREDDAITTDLVGDLQAVAHRSKYSSQGFDADDLVGEAALEILEAERSGRLTERTRIPRAYIDKIMHGKSVRTMSDRSSRDVTAYGQYTTALTQEQARNGHTLTTGEEDALAEKVRQSIPPKNRPAPGYHRKTREDRSLDAPDSDGIAHDTPAAGDDYAPVEYTPEDHAMLELAERLEAEGEANPEYRRLLARRAWAVNAVITNRRDGAWRRPVPTPLSQQVPVRRITTSTSRLHNAGGAVVAARRWLDGDESHGPDLFLPFGDLSREDRDAVADFIVEQSDRHGEDAAAAMFTSAAGQARADAQDSTSVEIDRMLGLHAGGDGAGRI